MNILEKEFVPYEQALALKELGFDEPCFVKVWWLNSINRHTKEPYKPRITMNGQDIKFEYPTPEKHPSTEFDILELQVPTFSQAFRWFDEHTDLMGFVVPSIKDNHFDWLIRIDWEEEIECEEAYSSRSEAELACLRKLIEIVKQNQ